MFRLQFSKILLAVLALAICTGTLQASAVLAGPAGVTLNCDFSTGPGAAVNVGIKLASGSTSLTVTPSFPAGSPLAAAPGAAPVASSTTAVNFAFNVAAGCAGAYNGEVVVLTFTPNSGAALTVNATLSITGTPLAAPSSSTVTLNCDTVTGPAAATQIPIKLKTTWPALATPAGGYSVAVSYTGNGAAAMAAAPASALVGSSTVATNFSVNMASGCTLANNNQTVTITFTPSSTGTGYVAPSGTNTVTVTATLAVSTPVLASSAASGITLNCDTVLGPTPANIGITLASGSSALTVTATSAATTVVLVAPNSNSVGSSSVPVLWGVHGAAGCKGWVNAATVLLTFAPSSGENLVITATLSLTNSGTALAASPSSVIITCTKVGTTYSSISSATVNITSPANYGTPFYLHTYGSAVTVTGGGTSGSPVLAGSTATPLTVTAPAGCANLPVGNTIQNFTLSNPPAADLTVPVTIQVGGAAPLTTTAVALTYVKASGTYTPVSSTLTGGTPGMFYQVDTTTLPLWLNVAATSGTISGSSPNTVSFLPTAGAETLALGTYSATVHLKVSGDLDSTVPVTLQVKSASETIVLSEGIAQSATWILGNAPPTFSITPISTGDAPIAYSVTHTSLTNSLDPQVSATSGVAYSFGPALSVSFLQAPFSAATPGEVLTGSVTISWGSSSSATVTFTVTAVSPSATITSISPSSLPTATSGTFNVVITGSGFVTATGLITNVGVISAGLVIPDANIAATVQNATTIDLVITVPTGTDTFLPFSGNGGTVHLAVCNPTVASVPCFTPTSTYNLAIGINPIVQSVSSASSFMQATPPALPSVAPYDMLSLFGTNFCISGGTGCTSGAPILYGQKDPVTLRYLTQLSPDASGPTQRNLTVTFQTHGASPTAIATAPLLFATNTQINLMVPDAVKAYYGNTVDMVVSFGYGQGSNLLSSLPYSMTITPTDPGIFAMTGDGQGDAAALSYSYALINQTNPAGATPTTSDTIALYVTGLGRPDANSGQNPDTGYSATCMTTDAYWALVNTAVTPSIALTSDDGLVLQPSMYPANTIEPCISTASPNLPTVTVGGVNAPVTFAGWVSGSVAGLYQINITLPTSAALSGASAPVTLTTTAQKVPVVVTAGVAAKTSQPSGVNIWMVKSPVFTVTPKTFSVAAGALSSSPAPQPFAVTGNKGTLVYSAPTTGTGALPLGITMNSDGSLAGTPDPSSVGGPYTVTVTVTDTNGWTGTVSLSITITT
jgi:uncharacterized protein (TIGR03437 family)